MGSRREKHKGPPYLMRTGNDLAWITPGVIRDFGRSCLIPKVQFPRIRGVFVNNVAAVSKWVVVDISRGPEAESGAVRFNAAINTTCHVDSSRARYPAAIMSEAGRSTASAPKPDQNNLECTLESLKMTREELMKERYPVTGVKFDEIEGDGSGFAIDCEMCMSGSEHVLTRIAVLRLDDLSVIYNELVVPPTPVTDCLTRFSGITPEMLATATLTRGDVQQWLRKHIGRTDYLVGHSLVNDLRVLGMQHNRVLDTAVLYPHVRGSHMHNSLRYLAKQFLDLVIQNPAEIKPIADTVSEAVSEAVTESGNAGETESTHETKEQKDVIGHDPVEDARACALLVRWMLLNGRRSGDLATQKEALTAEFAKHDIHSTLVGSRVPLWDAYGVADHVMRPTVAQCVDAAVTALNRSAFVALTLDMDMSDFNVPAIQSAIDKLYDSSPYGTAFTLLFAPPRSVYDRSAYLSKQLRDALRDNTKFTLEEINAMKTEASKLLNAVKELQTQLHIKAPDDTALAKQMEVRARKHEIRLMKKKALKETIPSTEINLNVRTDTDQTELVLPDSQENEAKLATTKMKNDHASKMERKSAHKAAKLTKFEALKAVKAVKSEALVAERWARKSQKGPTKIGEGPKKDGKTGKTGKTTGVTKSSNEETSKEYYCAPKKAIKKMKLDMVHSRDAETSSISSVESESTEGAPRRKVRGALRRKLRRKPVDTPE